jgi:exosortase/archaeosortase family protein
MTLVTLAVVFAYFTHPRDDSSNKPQGPQGIGGQRSVPSRLKNYGLWRSTIIFLSAVPIAIFTNALRVSGTGILARYYGTKVADGFFHTFSGWVVYVVAFLLLFGVGCLLDRFKSGAGSAHSLTKSPNLATGQLAPAEGGES